MQIEQDQLKKRVTEDFRQGSHGCYLDDMFSTK